MSAAKPLAIHRERSVSLKVSASTHRWLTAFAKANGITAGELLAQAAFCFADHAGRRSGSWEGSVAGDMARSCGYQQEIHWQARIKIIEREDRDLAEWRATLPPNPAELLTRAAP